METGYDQLDSQKEDLLVAQRTIEASHSEIVKQNDRATLLNFPFSAFVNLWYDTI